MKRRWLDFWYGRYFVTVAIGGIVIPVGWQWEGDYLDWRCSPIKIVRRRGR